MILETTFVIDLLRGKQDAIEKANELDRKNESVFITSVTVFELWQGLDAKLSQKSEKMNKFIESFGLLNLDKDSAKLAGDIHRELSERGLIIDPEDSMIAGIAIKNSESLLTRDQHYSRIKGLRIETY